jgi:hypothetical protein
MQNSREHRFSAKVLCEVVGNLNCDPHCIEGSLTSASYAHFLENELHFHLSYVLFEQEDEYGYSSAAGEVTEHLNPKSGLGDVDQTGHQT